MNNSQVTLRLPLVHGHRGCRGLRPENTLSAFLHSLALGVDVLELDVVISADNQVVVSHEPWLSAAICLDRMGQTIAPTKEHRHNLFLMPYAAIRDCDCGSLQHPDFPEQANETSYKPLLSEVFAAVEAATDRLGRPPVRYSVEVKSSADGDNIYHPTPEKFLPLVLTELRAANVLARTTLLSFDTRVLQLAHQVLPALSTCLLSEPEETWAASIQRLGFLPTVFGPDYRTATASVILQFRSAYPLVQLVPWTINEPAEMLRFIAWGVDGITTDYPNRLLSLLAAY